MNISMLTQYIPSILSAHISKDITCHAMQQIDEVFFPPAEDSRFSTSYFIYYKH